MNGAWRQATRLAEQTPTSRNRAVDLLRAISILVVVFGHWLMASPWVDEEGDHLGHILSWASWSHWLTWGLQVMPIFFFVGGYSNGITWDAARRDGKSYGTWLHARLRRLLSPVLVLVVAWTLLGVGSHLAGVPAIYLEAGSQVALIPVWFLAVYSLMVMLAPAMREAWKRFGLGSLLLPVGLTVLGDLLYFWSAWPLLGWGNYFTLWLAVHQLGFLWLDHPKRGTGLPLLSLLGGYALLFALTEYGPWPRSLVGVPGEAISNSTPPHLPLLALAFGQFGLVLLAERPLNRWLQRGPVWTGVILLSGVIMTVFLWHSTVMMLSYGLAFLADGFGLRTLPGEPGWWSVHWLWVGVFTIGMLPFVALFARFERPSFSRAAPPSVPAMLGGTLLLAAGLALLAFDGIDADNRSGIRWPVILLVLAGAVVAGIWRKKERRPS